MPGTAFRCLSGQQAVWLLCCQAGQCDEKERQRHCYAQPAEIHLYPVKYLHKAVNGAFNQA